MLWRLSIYDYKGEVKNFDYSIHGNQIGPATPNEENLAWLTEVPAAKLYAALEHGESLSSMYVQIKTAIKDVDIMEDPLIRTLFTGVFGAYQIAQLKQLSDQLTL